MQAMLAMLVLIGTPSTREVIRSKIKKSNMKLRKSTFLGT
ncbi:unnamed protein product [Gulo gulo]|uniref:Uncharacterized protein n=1 Tax=Gulo gulo TaxID=48420 RepID=A0A9X9PVB7_GULGU|nr:unnamed protein product [Gulo gulo]